MKPSAATRVRPPLVTAAKAILDKGTNPEQAQFFPYLRGYVAFYRQDYKTAAEELLKTNQNDPFIQCQLGQTYEKLGEEDKAIESYRKAAAATAHNPPAACAVPFAKKKLASFGDNQSIRLREIVTAGPLGPSWSPETNEYQTRKIPPASSNPPNQDWIPSLDQWGAKFQLIVPDFRGHGRSGILLLPVGVSQSPSARMTQLRTYLLCSITCPGPSKQVMSASAFSGRICVYNLRPHLMKERNEFRFLRDAEMTNRYDRRDILKAAGAVCAASFLSAPRREAAPQNLQIAGRNVEVQIAPVSADTFRLSVLPIEGGQPQSVKGNGSLVQASWGPPLAKFTGAERERTIKTGEVSVKLGANPLQAVVQNSKDDVVQQLTIDFETGAVSFTMGDSAFLGLGEGGPQFNRRGSKDEMRSGQGGYQLRTHGGRVPIPWLIGTAGWALYFHLPFGTFDFTGGEGKFIPRDPASALPLDIFVVISQQPKVLMAEYARLTGHPEFPPLWSFGYQQSHRTLASHDEVIAEAKTFREKKLPCDTLIYLGTGFCPSGWNTENGSFSWNKRVFPDPMQAIDELHKEHFRVVLHSVILENDLRGTVHGPCSLTRFDKEQVSCAWDAHRKTSALGVDGWWPDEGDPLNIEARLARNRMYWEGPQLDRPNERPYALHRNGFAGMQRYASFLWSGDVYSTWETLQTHIPIAINTGLTGIPYWGTDIGGFVPTKEFTAELYLRWFQFGAFCTLFRCHGRAWKLRLPWGWNTGETGPTEISNYGGSALPDPSELHNAQVEPICRKYIELRYRLLPYLYSAVREATLTGMPVMRSLWLHYPDDPQASQRGDEYLWGRDILVAPVVEKGATTRRLYLPPGRWSDFWTNERQDGGREIERAVDLETLPLFVREGAILPQGLVKQYVDEKVDGPLAITVYPGAHGEFLLYEDDGISFNYRKGDWMGIQLKWNESQRTLTMRLAPGARMRPPLRRNIEVKLGESVKKVEFDGRPLEVRF